jgi:hypothetical protein
VRVAVKILAVGRPRDGLDPGELARLAREEMHALWELYRKGTVREMYSPGSPGAILVLETSSHREADDALAGLPLVESGLVGFEVTELQPFVAFEVLFTTSRAEPG